MNPLEPNIPLASLIDDWGRWFLRTYFIGSLLTLSFLSLYCMVADFPKPYVIALILAAVIVPAIFLGSAYRGA